MLKYLLPMITICSCSTPHLPAGVRYLGVRHPPALEEASLVSLASCGVSVQRSPRSQGISDEVLGDLLRDTVLYWSAVSASQQSAFYYYVKPRTICATLRAHRVRVEFIDRQWLQCGDGLAVGCYSGSAKTIQVTTLSETDAGEMTKRLNTVIRHEFSHAILHAVQARLIDEELLFSVVPGLSPVLPYHDDGMWR